MNALPIEDLLTKPTSCHTSLTKATLLFANLRFARTAYGLTNPLHGLQIFDLQCTAKLCLQTYGLHAYGLYAAAWLCPLVGCTAIGCATPANRRFAGLTKSKILYANKTVGFVRGFVRIVTLCKRQLTYGRLIFAMRLLKPPIFLFVLRGPSQGLIGFLYFDNDSFSRWFIPLTHT